MKFLPIGCIVELVEGYSRVYAAEAGARGVIEGRLQEEGFDYYQIVWDKEDPKVNGQENGLVDCHHVRPIKEVADADREKDFNFSRKVGQKILSDDSITAFLTIVVKDGNIPYIVTDAKTPIDALKLIPDIVAIAAQLTETCVDSTIKAYETIERLKDAQDVLDLLDGLEDDDLGSNN